MIPVDQHRRASLLFAGGTALFMAWLDGPASGATLFAGLCLPLGLIWFAEPLGDFVGMVGLRPISRSSPPGLVRAFGWVALVVMASLVIAALIRGHRG